ncbi:MAG: hypothetical protein WCK33_00780 [Phycisphaerae bacterium]
MSVPTMSKGPFVPFLAAITLFGGLGWWTWRMQEEQLAATKAALAINDQGPPRPVADVASAVETAKLVSVEIDTKVRVERGEASWRGDVRAVIEVPVRLSYGVDLSQMRTDRLAWSPASRAYVVTVPAPTRIATEIFSERREPDVEVGWLRLRSQAGEFYLSQARRDVAAAAASLQLRPDDAKRVEDSTRQRLAALVRSIAGPDVGVIVRFSPSERG